MNFVVLDLELTQNPGTTPKIIQIGAAKMNSRTGRVESTFSEICNPGEVPDAFITELTGISAEAVSGAKPIKEVLEAFGLGSLISRLEVLSTSGEGVIPMIWSMHPKPRK